MVTIRPYINVPNAKRAIETYKELFDAKVVSHQPMSPEMAGGKEIPDDFDYENSTIHAVIDILGAQLYMSDSMSPPSNEANAVKVLLELDSEEQLDAIWAKVKEMNLKILMEVEKTFWGAMFGMFEDPEGIQWQINYAEMPAEGAQAAPEVSAKKAAKKAKKAKKAAR